MTTTTHEGSDLLRPAQVVERMQGVVSVRLLGDWRRTGVGPRWLKLGSRVYYRAADVDDWLAAQYEREA